MTRLIKVSLSAFAAASLTLATLPSASGQAQQPLPGQQPQVPQMVPLNRGPAAAAAPVAQPPRPPAWANSLKPEEIQWLDEVLGYWEFSSSQIKRYRCQFIRFEYDPIFGPPPPIYKTWSEGIIQYAAPDKGMYKIEKVMHFVPPLPQNGDPANYQDRSAALREHWICDGSSIFEHDYQKQQLKQYKLAPELHGQRISEGPLPFLFGVNKEKIKQRYWIRNIAGPKTAGEYVLEAWPKTAQDAANYQKVQVIIDQEDYLPKALVLFDPNFDERTRPVYKSFQFNNREKNWNIIAEHLNLFHREFYEPATQAGWQKIIEQFPAGGEAPARAPAAPLRSTGVPTGQRR